MARLRQIKPRSEVARPPATLPARPPPAASAPTPRSSRARLRRARLPTPRPATPATQRPHPPAHARARPLLSRSARARLPTPRPATPVAQCPRRVRPVPLRNAHAGRATNTGASRPSAPKMTQLSRLSNQAAYRLHESRGLGPGVLVAFVENVKKSCKKLAQKLSDMDTLYEQPPLPARSGATSSVSLRTSAGSSQQMTSATSAVRTPPHHSAGKDPATEDEEDDNDDDDQWEDWPQDEIDMCQLGGVPLGTQGASQGTSRTHRQRDHTDVGYTPNVLPTNPKRQRRLRDPYTPGS
ncbi:stress response protein NST1-like [Miscanthus floridulus]|uniref:stress response protein NST1-like n=1 Tax=Miscanthus floridulus TaxID=154761 RepID=UPI0034584169